MLLPDMRSDILSLIEGCDKIINKYESDLILLSVEQPKIPATLKEGLTRLIEVNVTCVEALISGFKSFLAGSGTVDFVEQVYRLEHQVDLLAMDLKQVVFQKLRIPLARQMQLKEFIYGIEKISDMAEDTTDMISVMVVKHAI
jgi:predicted phosphate transport protein (TIGR00153 family)